MPLSISLLLVFCLLFTENDSSSWNSIKIYIIEIELFLYVMFNAYNLVFFLTQASMDVQKHIKRDIVVFINSFHKNDPII